MKYALVERLSRETSSAMAHLSHVSGTSVLGVHAMTWRSLGAGGPICADLFLACLVLD
jgi:hypothetical protein